MVPEALWATIMAVTVMEKMEFSWLADVEEGLTIVDKAREWVEKQGAALFGEEGSQPRHAASLYSEQSRKRRAEESGRAPKNAGGSGCLGGALSQVLRGSDHEGQELVRAELREGGRLCNPTSQRGRGGWAPQCGPHIAGGLRPLPPEP